MAQTSLVSIITPAFNADAHLAEAIESCLAQTYGNFEFLIVDDGSTDDTGAVADRFARSDSRIRVFKTPNRGISAARNTALRHSRGGLFALLDSDDRWMPSYLEKQVSTLIGRPQVDVVTANAINVGGHLDGMPYWPPSGEIRGLSMVEIIVREDAVHIMSVFRRSVVDRIGGFDETLRGNEDYNFWLRAAAAGCRFVADFTPRAYYRRRPDSVSSDERRMLAGIIRVLQEIRPECPRDGEEVHAIDGQLRRFHRELMVADARACLASGDSAGAVACLDRIASSDRGRLLSALLSIARVWPPAVSYSYGAKQMIRKLRARVAGGESRGSAAVFV